jgi:hypothetical protein
MKHALRLARRHAALAGLHPLLALASAVQWTDATWCLQAAVAARETDLANLNATRRHDSA